MVALYIALGLIALFLLVLVIRALCFRPKAQPQAIRDAVMFDRDAAVSALQQLVRCKTISYNDKSLEDDAEFQKLIDLLPALYPKVFEACTLTQLPDRALLFRWPANHPTSLRS